VVFKNGKNTYFLKLYIVKINGIFCFDFDAWEKIKGMIDLS